MLIKSKDVFRVVLVADCHIGAERSPKWRGLHLSDTKYDQPLADAVAWAERNDADAFIVAGDLFHDRSPLPFDYMRARDILPFNTLVVAGNHDIGATGNRDALWAQRQVARGAPNVYRVLSNELKEPGLANELRHSLQVLALPWPRPSDVLRKLPSDSLEEEILHTRTKILESLTDLTKSLSDKAPAILVGHAMVSKQPVSHNKNAHLIPDPGLMLGKDVVLPLSALEALEGIDGIFLGHVHDPEIFPYIGSTQPTDWGDAGEKSFTVADIPLKNVATSRKILVHKIPYKTSLKLWDFDVPWRDRPAPDNDDELNRQVFISHLDEIPTVPDGIRCTVKADPGVKVPVEWIRETLGRVGTVHSVNVEYPPSVIARVSPVPGKPLTSFSETAIANVWLDQAEIETGTRRTHIMDEFEAVRKVTTW